MISFQNKFSFELAALHRSLIGPQHFVQKHKRSWTLGEKVVEEDDQYKNLGVVKNYAGSFQFDIDEAIEKTRKKAGMILNGCTDHKKTNLTIYVKLWKQMCLPSLLFGSELWMPEMVLQKVFHLPKFTNGPVLMKVSGLRSIEVEIHYRKLLFFASKERNWFVDFF